MVALEPSSAAHEITVRRIEFDFPDGLDPLNVVQGCPEESAFNVGMSLLLPYLEPYLIRSMNLAKKHIKDERLLDALERFNGQEGQHYRQHIRFNRKLACQGYDALPAFEAKLEADYARFLKERSLRFNLAYAEGFEALTSAVALFTFEHDLVERFEPSAKDLFLWHLVEELEHRNVAFEVYEHVAGGYLYRLFVGLFAQWHMLSWIVGVARYLTKTRNDRMKGEFGGAKGARARLLPLLWLQLRRLLPAVLRTYLPWYTPRRIAFPEKAKEVAARYTALARSAS